MAKRKKKKSKAAKIDWRHILIQAATDFFVGLLLEIFARLLK